MEMYFYEQSIFFHVVSVSIITSCTKKRLFHSRNPHLLAFCE